MTGTCACASGTPALAVRRNPQKITEGTLSAKTRRGAHSRLSSGLSLMVKMGHIQRNLATGLGPGRSKRKKVQALSIDEDTGPCWTTSPSTMRR